MYCLGGVFGAGDGIRTRDINLGKVALYQLSYSRLGVPLTTASRDILKYRKGHSDCQIHGSVTRT
jgi:hypothetical protein